MLSARSCCNGNWSGSGSTVLFFVLICVFVCGQALSSAVVVSKAKDGVVSLKTDVPDGSSVVVSVTRNGKIDSYRSEVFDGRVEIHGVVMGEDEQVDVSMNVVSVCPQMDPLNLVMNHRYAGHGGEHFVRFQVVYDSSECVERRFATHARLYINSIPLQQQPTTASAEEVHGLFAFELPLSSAVVAVELRNETHPFCRRAQFFLPHGQEERDRQIVHEQRKREESMLRHKEGRRFENEIERLSKLDRERAKRLLAEEEARRRADERNSSNSTPSSSVEERLLVEQKEEVLALAAQEQTS